MDYEYTWLPGSLVQPSLLAEMADLYSHHYGIWATSALHNPGGRIHLSGNRIGALLAPRDSRIALATLGGTLVGYAIAIQTSVPKYGVVSWVTQLVVHAEHRRNDVGKTLLFSIWNFSSHFAWGLVTANPYAVRALEKATRRRCVPSRIARNQRKLMNVACGNVPYVKTETGRQITAEVSRLNTNFFLDHSELPAMLASVISESKPWLLGPLEDGWEWLAFTFHDQSEIGLTPEELDKMLKASDHVARQAYSRMLLNRDHVWARHASQEAEFVVDHCKLQKGAAVLDLGCGTGRHALELAARGIDVTGVDYVDSLVARARSAAVSRGLQAQFFNADCRTVDMGRLYDAAICLYDVVGTYADDAENESILRNAVRHLKTDGMALISVMNFELTERLAKQFFSISKEPDKLLQLAPSQTMEKTGNIFDPDYYMIEQSTNVVYRKEQFSAGTALPAELIIRDRRYRRAEIELLCRAAGCEVLWSRCVRAGAWDVALEDDDDHAKEILLLCRKRARDFC
jgi:2-polyprenyl-3-methyl-5-hydroxy-6-metoxy-1,4-benzoquinol methylase